jgi:uncharacterized protein YndB with AHSA1/START domain
MPDYDVTSATTATTSEINLEQPMTPADLTPDQDAIVFEIQIAAPPERVFQALTDPKQLMRWWGQEGECKASLWEMDARPGGRWRFQATDPSGKVVVNGVSDFKAGGEILEFDPPRVLAYTWIANWHAQPTRATVVRWELAPSQGGTLAKVTHSGLAREAVARKDYSGGWPGVLEWLKKHMER